MAELTPNGTDICGGDHIWDRSSYMRCEDCEFDGLAKNFDVPDEK